MTNRSVLFVDDESIIREAMGSLLTRHFKTIHTAADGEEGLRVFREMNPDVVITDVIMPKMSGIDLAKGIRETDQDTPIIFITASQRDTLQPDCELLKVIGYLQKPIDKDDLEKLLRECS